ncbi:hypothetical protein M885DRAFT_586495 [Pelagophyceae sp. CCMP2097]|nr:hypothetical protein M885DRAFT_586495 [Pelagophyceae sp. CCMP2097]
MRRGHGDVFPALCFMVFIGPTNFVLYKILFTVYGERSAFFVSQGINVLYVVYGGVALYPQMWRKDSEITPAMRALPRGPFALMALLDCLGTFSAAMGAVDTDGQLQMLLNQSLVPCTMVASRLFLGTRYAASEAAGAAIIICGGAVVLAPALASGAGFDARPHACASALLYWGSNLPMALSAVYKQHRFAGDRVHVLYLTQQVSVYQLAFGFLLAPLQVIPGVATDGGTPPRRIVEDFARGCAAFARVRSPQCYLLVAYVLANFALNTTGLYVNKRAGAALTAVAYSLLLPLTTLAYALPWLGEHREQVRPTTLLGLGIVLAGFFVYESRHLGGAAGETAACDDDALLAPSRTADKRADAFSERLILVQVDIAPSKSALADAGREDASLLQLARQQPRAKTPH